MKEIYENSISWDEHLWRYFSTERFLSTLDSSSLYFSAATQFEDTFEGAIAIISPEYKVDPRYQERDHVEAAFYELKRLTKISCWHRASFESDAMWKLYAMQHKGVAITSTPERIRKALTPYKIEPNFGDEQLFGGVVKYLDLASARINTSMFEIFYHKHMAFEWEKEFRLAISLRVAEEFGCNVPEKGIQVKVNLTDLIERIVLGPKLTLEEKYSIIEKCKSCGLAEKIEISTLLYTPKYT